MGTVTISGPSPTSTKVPPERVAWGANTQTGYILHNVAAGDCAGSVKNKATFCGCSGLPEAQQRSWGEAGCSQESARVKHVVIKAKNAVF